MKIVSHKELKVWQQSIELVMLVYKTISRFLRISYGSSAELETQLLISEKLFFISKNECTSVEEQIIIVKKMLNKLMSSLT